MLSARAKMWPLTHWNDGPSRRPCRPGEELLPTPVEMDLNAVAIVFDVMKPLLTLRGLGLQRGELGLNEARHA